MFSSIALFVFHSPSPKDVCSTPSSHPALRSSMNTLLPFILLVISYSFIHLASGWNSDLTCFPNGDRDLAPIYPGDCYGLFRLLALLPYLHSTKTWSPTANGPSRLPFFLKSDTCQLWFVKLPDPHSNFEQFALIEAVQNMTAVIRHCVIGRSPHSGGPWGGYMDIGEYDGIRMSLVNHRFPPRAPEPWSDRPDLEPKPKNTSTRAGDRSHTHMNVRFNDEA